MINQPGQTQAKNSQGILQPTLGNIIYRVQGIGHLLLQRMRLLNSILMAIFLEWDSNGDR